MLDAFADDLPKATVWDKNSLFSFKAVRPLKRVDEAHHHAVGNVRTTVEDLIRAKLERGKYWADFAAADLEEVAASLEGLLASLPAAVADEHIHEDAPLTFDVSSLAGHLEGLAARQSANVANFVSTLGRGSATAFGAYARGDGPWSRHDRCPRQ